MDRAAGLDPQAGRLLDMLALRGPTSAAGVGIAERRAAFRGLMRFGGAPTPVARVEDQVLPGAEGPLPVRRYVPSADKDARLPTLVYFHGGGLIAGDLDTHDGLCRALADASGSQLIAVGYRLAPEHPFPAAIDDARASTEWVVANAVELGADRNRIAVGGDSAGGTLAALAAISLRQNNSVTLAAQLLLCPILDFAAETASRRTFQTPLLDQAMLAADIGLYAAGATVPSDPRLSPLRAQEVIGLPRTLLHTAECDPLRDEGQIYAEKLRAAGVEIRHTCHPGMPHLFYAMAGIIPYARTALRQIGAELRAALHS